LKFHPSAAAEQIVGRERRERVSLMIGPAMFE